ncbi:MAG: FMN-binding negative transcriptional regulator [Bacteroidetes bacterium]|nr:FMN-binding negative transcriptional regulator [Bacteroidota bacterium]
MYIPKHFREDDIDKIKAFMKAYNFGVILSNDGSAMTGTHLPFLMQESDDGTFSLVSHLAAANPQLKHWEKSTNCLVIFSGPHGYVSPNLYAEQQNVPTWNYIAVHVYGNIKVYNDFEQKKVILNQSIQCFEPDYQQQFESLDPKYRDKLINGMTGIEVQITQLEAKYKLSQNKSEISRKNVGDHFKNEGNELGKFM